MMLVSALCRVEIASAIWRKAQQGEIDETEAEQLIRDFQADLRSNRPDGPELLSMAVTTELLRSAARLVPIHDLRSLDAIQLASAIAARDLDPVCGTFACFDKPLSRAAAAHGFQLISSS